ncbi:hypothetical protein Hanom_Chr07g00618721 [Helianthus anomalus]
MNYGPLNHNSALYLDVKKLNFADLRCFLQNSAVLACFWHFRAPKSSLGRQFCNPYFPTHYSSVTLGFGAYFVS